MVDWNVILSSALQAVLIVLLPPLAASAARWLWAKADDLWGRAELWNPTVTQMVEQAASFAVAAAEQAGAAKLITDKKSYALAVAQAWLSENKISVDLALLDAAIEKAVGEVFNTPHLES